MVVWTGPGLLEGGLKVDGEGVNVKRGVAHVEVVVVVGMMGRDPSW